MSRPRAVAGELHPHPVDATLTGSDASYLAVGGEAECPDTVVHRRLGEIDEFQELPTDEEFASASVTVTYADGSLHSYHSETELGGIGFEFVDSGILVLRFAESDRLVMALAPGAWACVTGTALGDRGRRSSSGQ